MNYAQNHCFERFLERMISGFFRCIKKLQIFNKINVLERTNLPFYGAFQTGIKIAYAHVSHHVSNNTWWFLWKQIFGIYPTSTLRVPYRGHMWGKKGKDE